MRNTISSNLVLIITALVLNNLSATDLKKANDSNKPKIMLFGTFHFDDPGLDVVKFSSTDVMTADNQAYLTKFAQRVANKFAPTQVLIECSKQQTDELNQRYQQYLKDDYKLPRNENYQIGFRLAKLALVEKITCYDEREINFNGKELLEHMAKNEPEESAAFQAFVSKITTKMNKLHQTLTLKQLLQKNNDQKFDALNKSFYLLVNDIGAFDNYLGADASASWWHRNFRMYSNVQHMAKPGERVFVVGGQGHIAILKDLAQLDSEREVVDVNPLL